MCVELWDHLKMVYHVSYTSVYGIKHPGTNLQKTRDVVVNLALHFLCCFIVGGSNWNNKHFFAIN